MTKMENETFELIIAEKFADIISGYKLKVESNSNEWGLDMKLVGSKCGLSFSYDRGDLRCSFLNPKTKRKYLSNLVYQKFYPKDASYVFSINDSIEDQLSTYSRMINDRFSGILEGDFSWAEDFEKRYGVHV